MHDKFLVSLDYVQQSAKISFFIPMLKYGLQALHNSELHLISRTSDRPSKDALKRIYQTFMQ